MMDNIQNALNRVARQYGAEIVDVRIKRADLPNGTPLDSAYQRMQTARQQEARSIEAQGYKQAQIIRAEADAEAARDLCRRLQPGSGFLRFLPRDAVLRGELSDRRPGRGATRADQHHPFAQQRISAAVPGQSMTASRVIQSPFSLPIIACRAAGLAAIGIGRIDHSALRLRNHRRHSPRRRRRDPDPQPGRRAGRAERARRDRRGRAGRRADELRQPRRAAAAGGGQHLDPAERPDPAPPAAARLRGILPPLRRRGAAGPGPRAKARSPSAAARWARASSSRPTAISSPTTMSSPRPAPTRWSSRSR